MSIGQGAVAGLCCWEGNRRSDVALAMRHRRCGISTSGLYGLEKTDEPAQQRPLTSLITSTQMLHCAGKTVEAITPSELSSHVIQL